MKKKEYIFVKANNQYLDSYQVAQFKSFKRGTIFVNKKSIKKFDFWQEMNGNNPPKIDAWKDSKGNIVSWDFMESKNTYPAITLVSDTELAPINGDYPFDTWRDNNGNLVCYISDVKKYKDK